ncbi:MAG: AMP-binding protein, partial [Clostridia bacterium]|nr:AMP-binding protein [Clostridia bacterium]
MKTYNNLFPYQKPRVISDFRDMVRGNAEAYGDKALYVYKHNGENVEVSYNEFYSRVRALGTALKARGLAGKNIAVTGDTHPNWTAAFIAVVCAGGVAVPLDRDLDAEQAADFMKIAECSAVVYTPALNDKIEGMKNSLSFLDYLIPVESTAEGAKILPFDT